jgi:hypothetical protein
VVVASLALVLGACGGKSEHPALRQAPSTAPSKTVESQPAADPGYGAAEVGECHQMSARQSLASVDTSSEVSCRKSHTSVVAFVGYLPKPVTAATPLPRRQALGKRKCQPAYQKVVGGTEADRATSILTWTMFTPSQSQLERGARWVRCDVVARSGDRLVPLPTPSPMLAQGVPEQVRICQTEAGVDVSCRKEHQFRVEAVYRAVLKSYPATASYTAVARARCRQLVGSSGGYWQPPSREGWAAGDRFIRCLSVQPAPSASATP